MKRGLSEVRRLANVQLRNVCLTVVFGLTLMAVWASPSYATDCSSSPIIFAFQGRIFATSEELRVSQIASGFRGVYTIRWAPGCRNFAFLDTGSLWLVKPQNIPVKLPIPGQVSNYFWSPDGRKIGATVERPACRTLSKGSKPGDVFTVSVLGGSPTELTQDCRSYLDGWSSDGHQLLVEREVKYKLTCDPSQPPCAGADLIVLDHTSKSTRTLLSAEELTRRGYSIGSLLHWDADRHTIFMSNQISPFFGSSSILVAIRDTDGKQLWARDGERGTWLGNQRIGLLRLAGSPQGVTFMPILLDTAGKQIGSFPVVGPSAGDWSPNLKYIVDEGENDWVVEFIRADSSKEWSYSLPEQTEYCAKAWTPENRLLVSAYQLRLNDNYLEMSLWILSPGSQSAKQLFHQNLTVKIDSGTNVRDNACGRIYPVSPPTLAFGTWEQQQ